MLEMKIVELIEYIDELDLTHKQEVEKATLLCFYYAKEYSETTFSMSRISSILEDAGFNKPNNTRLKNHLIKGANKAFRLNKDNTLGFIPAVYQRLEKDIGKLWEDTTTIVSDSDLIDENKFCGKRGYLTCLIQQINHCYANNCYDAAAVLMRRLFEIILILSYQNMGIDDEIKDRSGHGYLPLDSIIKNAMNNSTLKLSRIKREFNNFKQVGNFSAHGIEYTAVKKDIDDIQVNYRVMLEELYNKAGLL